MGWTVETQARFVRIAELIGAVGLPNVREPHVKQIRDSIWEIRLKGKAGQRVVVVRVFVKKTQKTPNTEIEIALERAKELEK